MWGFSESFRRLIAGCVKSVSYSLLINGNIKGNIFPNRGLRQGDPISLFLFILCSEFLSKLLNKEKTNGCLHSIKIDRGAPAINHLMYADDLLVMCRANEGDA